MSQDPNNPSGALPGDPRHGLSKEQLAAYYKTKSPSWICKGYFKTEGGLELREVRLGEASASFRHPSRPFGSPPGCTFEPSGNTNSGPPPGCP